MADGTKPQTKSAQIKAELFKSKLENRRSRTVDGTPIAYLSSKDDFTAQPKATTGIRESRSFSDPDISASLMIFSEANGLFSKANQVSSFKGNSAESLRAMTSEERPAFISTESMETKQHVKDLKSTFERCSNQQHMAEFSNPLHKGNQQRFRKGGGILPPKPVIGSKPVVAPKPPKVCSKPNKGDQQQTNDKTIPKEDISDSTLKTYCDDVCSKPNKGDQQQTNDKTIPKEDMSDSTLKTHCDDEHDDDGLYAKVSHERPSVPSHPPPRKLPNRITENKVSSTAKTVEKSGNLDIKHPEESLSDHGNEKELSAETPIYAQVDKSKKTNKILNRSESDPLPSNINVASGTTFEVLAQEPEVKQINDAISEEADSDQDSEAWDPSEFDNDDDSSDFEPSSGENSRSNSQDGKEMMNFPDERSKKLYNIAHEILTTERAYVRRLNLLDQVFYFRLQNECLAHGHITADVLHDVFSNITAIHSLHNDFLLPKLEERMSQWSTDNRIGDILKTLAPFLKLYTAYIANFDKSSETLSTWTKKSPVFASIIENIQKSKECENLILGHHMLEPIQRIPRYKLLLRDYLGKLPEDSPDYKDTQDAMEIISEAAAHANESMKKTERFNILLEIQERIIEDFSVVTAGRQLIKEGDLTKVSARHVAHQERTLLLFNDVLLCCAKSPGTNKLKVKVEMDLYGMETGEADEEVELSHTFRVTSKQKVIEFSASSQEERETWVKEINEAVQEFSRKRETYKRGSQPNAISNSELGKKAPVWVRDEVVTMCMSCDSLFTLTRRRHHCRSCGGIYCSPCCHHKALLEYSGKQERVCQTCHKVLVQGDKASLVKKNSEEKQHQDVRKISRDSKVILSGYLYYKGGKTSDKNWVKRWCVLSNTFEFYCYKAKKDTKAYFSLPLPGYVVDKPNMADNLDKKVAFKLHHKNVVVHYFSTDSQELLERWMHNLSYAVQAERIPEEESKESKQANTI